MTNPNIDDRPARMPTTIAALKQDIAGGYQVILTEAVFLEMINRIETLEAKETT